MDEQVLELARKVAQEAEVYGLSSQETLVSFEANRLKILQGRETQGMALRLIKDGRIGFASTTRSDDLQWLVDTALEMAGFGAAASFQLPAPQPVKGPLVFDERVAKLDVEQMVAMGQEMIEKVRAYDGAILCDAELRLLTATTRLTNSRGLQAQWQKTLFSAGIHGNLVRGTDMLDVWEEASWCSPEGVDPKQLVRNLIDKIAQAKDAAHVTTGCMPVIFTPKGVLMTIALPLQLAFNGKIVQQGASPLGDKLGQEIFDPRFSLYDDGTVDLAPASGPYDHEGVPTQRTPLVENGVVRNFYYDLQAAGKAGQRSTGNGRRGLDSLPAPAVTSWMIAPGQVSYADMVADIKEGIVVDQTMGAWAGNLLSGEFSGNVHLGYKVENGRIVGRVKDTMVAGNVFQALKELAAIGCQAEWVEGRAKVPPLYFQSLSVATKA